MQLARQTQVPFADRYPEDSEADFTPSGVYPVGRKDRETGKRSADEPFIVVHELSDIEAAQVALLEQGLEDDGWDYDEPWFDGAEEAASADGPDHTFEMAPVVVDLKLPVVGQDWEEDEETTRFMRGVPIVLPRAFGRADLRMARDLASDLTLAASSPGLASPVASPWESTPRRARAAPIPIESPRPEWSARQWVIAALLTFATEGALLGALALAFG